MKDLGNAITIYFATLGPLKTIPTFFVATVMPIGAPSRRWRPRAIVTTRIVLFVALGADIAELAFRRANAIRLRSAGVPEVVLPLSPALPRMVSTPIATQCSP